MKLHQDSRRLTGILLLASASLFGGAGSVLMALCGPFTDVTDPGFCPFVVEIFTLGITTGTTPTTYAPNDTVTRLQMAAFLSRTVDGVLKRGSSRAALGQFWTTQGAANLGLTTVGGNPLFVKSDGLDLWVGNSTPGTVSRVRRGDGKLLETWTGAVKAQAVLSAMGRIFVSGAVSPGQLYRIDPSQPAGAVTTVATNLGAFPLGLAFDGSRIWTSNAGGSVSIVTPGTALPWTVTTVTSGFTQLVGILYDGANIWVTDSSTAALLKLDSDGNVLQTVTAGGNQFPVFDGANIWVPINSDDQVRVVRASNGAILATLTGNGLTGPRVAAFDGQRVLVTNNPGDSVSVWKAADLTPIGSFSLGAGAFPWGACSDGIHFWIALDGTNQLARF